MLKGSTLSETTFEGILHRKITGVIMHNMQFCTIVVHNPRYSP